jgi:acetyl esterase
MLTLPRSILRTVIGCAVSVGAASLDPGPLRAADSAPSGSPAGRPTASPTATVPAKKSDYVTTRARELKPTRLVTYKKVGDLELRLRLFEPSGHQPADRRPCFLAIHGGGWVAGTPTIMYAVGDSFARRGWVVASMEYRFATKDGAATVFDSVRDVRSAVRYLRSHAAELGIDPQKILAGGRSAGGHLAVAAALCDGVDDPQDDPRVSCVPNVLALYSPVIDTSAEGYGHELIGERWRELSPRHLVRPGLPPTLVLHGTRDTVTPVVGAKAFHEAMQKVGNRSELVLHEGGGHSYMMRTEALFLDAMERTARFAAAAGLAK